MNVLIKGMEMPISCERCPMLDWDLDYIKCKVTGRHFKITECWRSIRVPDCPLISVPPHGRLGDLDELHKEAVRRAEKTGTYDSWYNCTDRVISAFDIEAAPTIIPASEEGE